MSPVFLVPYFSGAVNYQLPKEWLHIEQEVINYKNLRDNEKTRYNFINDPAQATLYNYNYVGLVYIIMAANFFLPWLGDVLALEYLQIFVHILITLIIYSILSNRIHKIAFLLLYSFNPFIIYFVTFPFYYFWQVLATVFLFPYLISKDFRYKNWIFVITPIFSLTFLTRPPILACIVLFFIIYFVIENKWKSICCLILFILLSTTFSAKKVGNSQTYWHTIFVGLGAYPGSPIHSLSDNEGISFFQNKTGKLISTSIPGGNFYTDMAIRNSYIETLQNEYLGILDTKPFLLVRNAAINFFQSFSLGYFVDYPLWVSYISAGIGFIFCLLLLYNKQFLWIIAIAASTITFTPYYPPIPAYMYGSYILIIGACISLLQNFKLFSPLSDKLKPN